MDMRKQAALKAWETRRANGFVPKPKPEKKDLAGLLDNWLAAPEKPKAKGKKRKAAA